MAEELASGGKILGKGHKSQSEKDSVAFFWLVNPNQSIASWVPPDHQHSLSFIWWNIRKWNLKMHFWQVGGVIELSIKSVSVHRRREIINPNVGFWRQMIKYEERLFRNTTVKMVQSPRGVIPDIYLKGPSH